MQIQQEDVCEWEAMENSLEVILIRWGISPSTGPDTVQALSLHPAAEIIRQLFSHITRRKQRLVCHVLGACIVQKRVAAHVRTT